MSFYFSILFGDMLRVVSYIVWFKIDSFLKVVGETFFIFSNPILYVLLSTASLLVSDMIYHEAGLKT